MCPFDVFMVPFLDVFMAWFVDVVSRRCGLLLFYRLSVLFSSSWFCLSVVVVLPCLLFLRSSKSRVNWVTRSFVSSWM